MGGRGSASKTAKQNGNVSPPAGGGGSQATQEPTKVEEQHYADSIFVDGEYKLVPDWFIRKNLSQEEAYAWSVGDGVTLDRETEKAVRVSQMTDYGRVSTWVPKSVLVPEKVAREQQKRMENAFDLGLRYNEYLRKTAKSAGVKLGSVRKTAKIISKLEQAGVKFDTKDAFATRK